MSEAGGLLYTSEILKINIYCSKRGKEGMSEKEYGYTLFFSEKNLAIFLRMYYT